LIASLAVIGCAADGSSADANLENEEFRLWCGESACAWEVDQGEVEKTPTWHRKVFGIALKIDPTRISQVAKMENVHCILLSLLADIDVDATLFWEIDFDNDNIDAPEYSVEVDVASWKTEHREAAVPKGCTEARIILRKTGRGSAVMAKADISGNIYCAASPNSVGPEGADTD
jgi:hypothetical protein